MTNDQQAAFEALLADIRCNRWRRLVWLSGTHDECLSVAAAMCRLLDKHTTWISDHPPQGVDHLIAHKAQSLLGKDIPALVFDAHQRFDPDAMAAACGAICAGGIALLLTPEATEWPTAPDLDKARIAVHPYGAEQVGNRFIRRLILQLGLDRQVVRWSCQRPWEYTPSSTPPLSPTQLLAEGITSDQKAAIEAVTAVVIGHRRRPAVLIADRGRGKSAALGIAAANLLAVRCERILVTAPRRSACDALFSHAESTLSRLTNRTDIIPNGLVFVAPDDLVENPQECDLLLVDEAAGLPIGLLKQLLKNYSRIAFATTVHGYEGSGRGFMLRFTEHLQSKTPGWKLINLNQPIRYAQNDPLEQTLFQSLLLNATLDPRPAPDPLDEDAPHVQRVNRDDLVHDEAQLREIYGLLVMAHYRTRPLDLRQLLDGPNVRVWSATWNDRVVAVALVCREGDINKELAAKIFSGERRPRGHLLAQTLIGHLGIDDAATMEGERVMRIVVHPDWQNRGIGQTLVEHICERARAEGLQWCGASFGATEQLLRFWGRCETWPIYIGSRREASSGAHSIMVICGLDEAGRLMVGDARENFKAKLPHWLAEQLRDLETPIISEVYRQLSSANNTDDQPGPGADPSLRIANAEWRTFAYKQRSYDEALPVLITEFLTVLTNGLATARLKPAELQILIMKLLQKRSWKAVASASGLSGRDQVVEAIRKASKKLSRR